ncbi:MAG: carboxypeptidase regulatory-like domain-containing protein [Trueperaceae bacterium]|nr:carboxypeptidase regulatory-like domain-containing protein [Trueperaceae bacterium]
MKQLTRLIGLLVVCFATACTEGSSPNPTPNPEPQQGHSVVGSVLDTAGKPLSGALVWLEPALTTGLTQTHTDITGHYKVEGLIDVPYYAKAWTEIDYNNQHFCLRLAMPNLTDYDSFVPSQGAVRNFQWQLTGAIPGLSEGYFGGEIRLFREGDMKGAKVQLSFTPTMPLADGSTGQAFTRSLDLDEELMLYDIPLGHYQVSAVLLENSDVIPLHVGLESSWTGYEGQTETADFGFSSSSLYCGNDNGIDRGFLYLNSPFEYE